MTADDIDIQFAAINKLIAGKKFDQALNMCEDLLSTRSSAESHRILGWKAQSLWAAGHRREAISTIEIAHNREPNWPGHLSHLALWLLECGDYLRAIEVCDKLVDIELQRKSKAFIDYARKISAYSALLAGRYKEAQKRAVEIEDDLPSRMAGRMVTKQDILDAASKSTHS
jgi:tetratricopeptide (TPR) repeat protein